MNEYGLGYLEALKNAMALIEQGYLKEASVNDLINTLESLEKRRQTQAASQNNPINSMLHDFRCAALGGLLANSDYGADMPKTEVAIDAENFAQAMLKIARGES